MKKGFFLGLNVVYFELISNDFKSKYYNVYNLESDFARMGKDGKMILIKEKDIVKEILNKGKGVVYKNNVIFKEESPEISEFLSLCNEYMENRKKFNNTLYKQCKDQYFYPIAKTILDLYTQGVINKETCIKKLEPYVENIVGLV